VIDSLEPSTVDNSASNATLFAEFKSKLALEIPNKIWETVNEIKHAERNDGDDDGPLDGILEGTLVGTTVGTPVGTPVGALVLGTLEGCPEGRTDGTDDGTSDGDDDGPLDGILEGTLVGTTVGTPVGTPVDTVDVVCSSDDSMFCFLFDSARVGVVFPFKWRFR
jgi:hypothetical protein